MDSPAYIEEAQSWESHSVAEKIPKPLVLLLILALATGFILGRVTIRSSDSLEISRETACLSGQQLREVAGFLAKEQEALLAALSGQRWRDSDTKGMYQRAIALLARLRAADI